jgi:aminobutyraldehyde dehydrogenase
MPTPSPTARAIVRRSTTATPLISPSDLPSSGQFIDGTFQPSNANRTLDIVDPCYETVLAAVAEGTVTDVDKAVTAARRAQPQWGRMTPKRPITGPIGNR